MLYTSISSFKVLAFKKATIVMLRKGIVGKNLRFLPERGFLLCPRGYNWRTQIHQFQRRLPHAVTQRELNGNLRLFSSISMGERGRIYESNKNQIPDSKALTGLMVWYRLTLGVLTGAVSIYVKDTKNLAIHY